VICGGPYDSSQGCSKGCSEENKTAVLLNFNDSRPNDDNYTSVSLNLSFDGDLSDAGPNGLDVVGISNPIPMIDGINSLNYPIPEGMISTVQSKSGGSSAYLYNTAIYVTPDQGFAFGNEDFTIETWAYMTDWSNGAPTLFDGLQLNNNNNYRSDCFVWQLIEEHNGRNTSSIYHNGTQHFFESSVDVPLNQWAHHALVRKNGTIFWFLNGSPVGAIKINLDVTSENCLIGRVGDTWNYTYHGYLDDYRITKGIARYYGEFTPPIKSFDDDNNSSSSSSSNQISLLLHLNMGSDFNDEGDYPTKIEPNGGVHIRPEQSKFGEGSAFFDGQAGSYIKIESTDPINPPLGDFTIDLWIYGTRDETERIITTGATGWSYGITAFSIQKIKSGYSNGESFLSISIAGNEYKTISPIIQQNFWHQICVSRKDGIFYLFLDGLLVKTIDAHTAYQIPPIKYIGQDVGGAFEDYFLGYIDEIRLSIGEALTSSFQVPTSHYQKKPSQISKNTILLMHMDGDYKDSSRKKIPFKAYQITGMPYITGNIKFGSGALVTNGGVLESQFPLEDISSGDWTVEFWLFVDNTNQFATILAIQRNEAYDLGAFPGLHIYVDYGFLCVDDAQSSDARIAFDIQNQWTHLAITWQSSTNTKIVYINGISVSATSQPMAPSAYRYKINIGAISWLVNISGNKEWFGFGNVIIDELRIAKILAYTSNFTPPTKPFKATTHIDSLLLHFEGPEGSTDFIDSANGLQSVALGSTAITTFKSKFGTSSVLFNGDYDRIYFDDNELFDLEDGDYTIECFVYLNDWSGSGDLKARIWAFENFESSWFLMVSNDGSGVLTVGTPIPTIPTSGFATRDVITSPVGTVSLNKWFHIALVKEKNIRTLYVEGKPVGPSTERCHPLVDDLNPVKRCRLSIGGSVNRWSSGPNLNGYVDEFRITKGISRYKNRFMPPISEYKIVDSSINEIVIKSKNVRITKTDSKFGSYSAYFTGKNSNLSLESNKLALGKDDFTIEFWIKPLEYPVNSIFTSGKRAGDLTGSGLTLGPYNLSGGLRLSDNYNNAILWTFLSLVKNEWNHVAIVRKSGEITLYVSGLYQASAPCSINFDSGKFLIGTSGFGSTVSLLGNIDDFRIVVGTAVYTANFNVNFLKRNDLTKVTSQVASSGPSSYFPTPSNELITYIPEVGDVIYCIPLEDYDSNLHEICGGPYYSKSQCYSCASSSSSSISSSSSAAPCFPVITVIDIELSPSSSGSSGQKMIHIECADEPASSTSCLPPPPPPEAVMCPNGNAIGTTFYFPDFENCTYVPYEQIYGSCNSSSSSESSSSCSSYVRHCLYSDFSIPLSLFTLEDKPPPCEYGFFCTQTGCEELCVDQPSGIRVDECDPFFCSPGVCLLDCYTQQSVLSAIDCALLGGMWFPDGAGVAEYKEENCRLDCWECLQTSFYCQKKSFYDRWQYPKPWTFTNQTEPVCDTGLYDNPEDCSEKCCGCVDCIDPPWDGTSRFDANGDGELDAAERAAGRAAAGNCCSKIDDNITGPLQPFAGKIIVWG
jgi:hypothetical protein